MIITVDSLIEKYGIKISGILHVGAHDCQELSTYETYIDRSKILWIEAMEDRVESNRQRFPGILIEHAVVSDTEETVIFNKSCGDGLSSSILELGIHKELHPWVYYESSYPVQSKVLRNILCKYETTCFNFLNLDIQGAELKALKGMEEYLPKVDYIYTEVNSDYIYKDCALIGEIDEFLGKYGFTRVETSWNDSQPDNTRNWGDAFYMRQ